MAKRRMFNIDVVNTDKIANMTVSSRCLYYELGMRADDDGFVANPIMLLRMLGFAEDDLRLLIEKGFIIPFDSGIIVITHWNMNNSIRKDRYQATIFSYEKNSLQCDQLGNYSLLTKDSYRIG